MAENFAKFQGDTLELGLGEINEEVAKCLAKFQGSFLSLNIKEINEEVAKNLAEYQGELDVSGNVFSKIMQYKKK